MTAERVRRRHVYVTLPMIARMQALWDAGLSLQAITRVIELDFGKRPSTTSVRKYVRREPGRRAVACLSRNQPTGFGTGHGTPKQEMEAANV